MPMSETAVFDLRLSCWCFNGEECICGDEEKVLRHYAAGKPLPPMTAKQREWCISEADQAAEGAWQPEALAVLSDRDLALAVLNAWSDYAKSRGMY